MVGESLVRGRQEFLVLLSPLQHLLSDTRIHLFPVYYLLNEDSPEVDKLVVRDLDEARGDFIGEVV